MKNCCKRNKCCKCNTCDVCFLTFGDTGPKGDIGIRGATGVNGDTGPTGPIGLSSFLVEVTDIAETTVTSGPLMLNAGDTLRFKSNTLNIVTIPGSVVVQIENPNIMGSTGPQGPQGATGSQGNNGNNGAQGIQGPTGPQGATGPQGNNGNNGAQGIQGIQGDTGSTGPQGNNGNNGAQGIQGDTGSTGPQGNNGNNGAQGIQGIQGPQGATGPQGNNGNNGIQGIQGPTGPQGATGPQGSLSAGFSANANHNQLIDTPIYVTGVENRILFTDFISLGSFGPTNITFPSSGIVTITVPGKYITTFGFQYNTVGLGSPILITSYVKLVRGINTRYVNYYSIGGNLLVGTDTVYNGITNILELASGDTLEPIFTFNDGGNPANNNFEIKAEWSVTQIQ